MPISINLLAEAQAAEESRRRDPVKRIVVGGALLLAGMLAWSSILQLKVMMANRELSVVKYEIDTHANAYQTIQTNIASIALGKLKISALEKLTNARLLQGNLLNALQKVYVDNIQLTRVKVDQACIGVLRANKSQAVVEKTVVTLNGRDSSSNPGDQVGKFKAALAAQPYFKGMLDATNAIRLTDETPPQQDSEGRNFVLFTLECHFPDKTR